MNWLILFALLVVVSISIKNISENNKQSLIPYEISGTLSLPTEDDSRISQGDIQDESYVDKVTHAEDYPYPQISRAFKKLSNGELIGPLQNIKDILPSSEPSIPYIRSQNKQRVYVPDYYRRDQMEGNSINSSELRPFTREDVESDQSWTDENVSEHPKFYTSDIKDEITNIGAFFDINNQYNDKSSKDTNSLVYDSCYLDKDGTEFCEDNTRLQLIPPRTISNPKKSKALSDIGLYNSNSKVMNGHKFFENVTGKKSYNESMSKPIETELGLCSF